MDANELLSTLRENPHNPRTITPDDFEKLKFKIRNFPEMLEKRPIAYDSSDNYFVLGGNRRLNALQALVKEGFAIKPEYFTDCAGWTPDQKRTFVILDNVSDGDWNYELLANEWTDLPLEEWGLDPTEWEKEKKEVKEDEPPAVNETEPAVSQLGEVYQLGRHRLMCGDATKIEDVEKLMNTQKADMVFTDPPYGMKYDVNMSDNLQHPKDGWTAKENNYSSVIGDDKPFDYQQFAWLDCKEQFWWGGDYYAKTIPDAGSWFVWDKREGIEDVKWSTSEFELCWSKQKHHRQIIRIRWSGLLGTEKEFDGKTGRVHPTQKPIALSAWFVNKYSQPEQKILDIFGGSGSTLIACEQTNRTCYMSELDPKYCDVIRKRYAKFIGRENDWQDIK